MIIGYFFENVSELQIVLETGDSILSAIGGALSMDEHVSQSLAVSNIDMHSADNLSRYWASCLYCH